MAITWKGTDCQIWSAIELISLRRIEVAVCILGVYGRPKWGSEGYKWPEGANGCIDGQVSSIERTRRLPNISVSSSKELDVRLEKCMTYAEADGAGDKKEAS